MESDLYTLWERSAATGTCFRCASGERVTIISRGRRNGASGPDYLNAVLLIEGHLVAGAVEMHTREADWFVHGHQNDPAYAAVRLHVLERREAQLHLAIPTLYAEELSAPAPEPAAAPAPAITPDLLAELAWSRLLRRVTVIIRTEPGLAPACRIRRAFIRRLFDCLGYSANRSAMKIVADQILRCEAELAGASRDVIAARVFSGAGIPADRVTASGTVFMSPDHLRHLAANILPEQLPCWRYDTRPANAPERRLWGAVALLENIYRHDLLPELCMALSDGGFERAAMMLQVRAGRERYVGAGRSREIVMNALIPAVLAAGVLAGSHADIASACLAYRHAPPLESNRVLRAVEAGYPAGAALSGGFWQQGSIEFHQRYLSPDRHDLSFIAEGG